MKAVVSDAGHKYRTALLESFDMRDITFLKRASWGGIVAETDRLYSTMFHDWDALQKDCNDIEKAVKSLDWSINPYVEKGDKVSRQAEDVAKTVEAALWQQDGVPAGEYSHVFAQLLGVLCHAIWRGQNVHQIVWKNNGKLVYPARYEQLLPQFLQWEMQPGRVDRLLLVPDGEGAQPVPFPKYKFIVALNNSGPDHPLYNATYYSLVAWFCAFKKGLGWFMQFCERFGLPKPVLHYDNPQDKEALIAQLNDNRVINAILLEGDRTVDWATVPASGQSLPQRELLSMAEAACHKAILGQTLTSDVSKSGGSLAQAKVHAGVQADTVMRYAEYVTDIINTQLIPAIVHLNYGNADMPMPELRCKLPQAVANIERAQFWAQVLQIPGMQVVKSDIYESLGIAMPAQGDEVLSTPDPQEHALEKAMQGFGLGNQEPDKGRKDETALAARTKEGGPKCIAGWLAPLKKKLLEAKKNGASFDELKQMMLEAHFNTRALAGAMEENIRSGFFGADEEELEAANPYGCNRYGHGEGCDVGKEMPEAAKKLQEQFEDGFFRSVTEGRTPEQRKRAWWNKIDFNRLEKDKETQKDAAPFYEIGGEVFSLVPTKKMKTWEDARKIIEEKRQKIEEEWEEWKRDTLEVLKDRDKESVYENIKRSLEEHDGVRSAVLKKRISEGVVSAPRYATSKERDKAYDKVYSDYKDKVKLCEEAHDMYYFYKRDQAADLMEEVGFTDVQADKSNQSSSMYLTGKLGNVYAKVRISDHDYPAINYYHRGSNAQLRVWQTREEFKREIMALKKRFIEGDFSDAVDNVKRPDGF